MTKSNKPSQDKMVEKKYKTIVIDPPWPLTFVQRKVRPNQTSMPYPTMSLKDIENLNISNIADENCKLFVWTTQRYLPDTLNIVKSWGFKYHLVLTWDKSSGMTMFGFHRRTEFVIFAYKGNLGSIGKKGKAIPSIFMEKAREHSRKPEIFQDFIDLNFDSPKLEMFARRKREGWDVWGNEVESDINL